MKKFNEEEYKCICGNNSFKIIYFKGCHDCKYNGVWDEKKDEYIYPDKVPEGEQYRQVAEDEMRVVFNLIALNAENFIHIFILFVTRRDKLYAKIY